MFDASVRNAALAATLYRGLGIGMLGVVGALTAGCPRSYPSCKQDQDCRPEMNETCIDSICQNCTTNEDCVAMAPPGEPAYTCREFRCQAPGGDVSGQFGPCTERSDCESGFACKAGICNSCTEDFDCAPLTCNISTGTCAPPGLCQNDDQCTMDEICDGGMCVFSGLDPGLSEDPCGLNAVFFAFDSDALTTEANDSLTTLAQCMATQQTDATVYLEAHADNRGTEEYNILLTERRGTKVRRFLMDNGVQGETLRVIAKGSLEATGTDEQTMANDRRVQIIWQ